MELSLLLAALAVMAGLITTVTGFGGGMLLVTVLALVWGPLPALAVSSLALLVGNGQRLYMYWRDVQINAGWRLVLGAIPGSVLGALIATSLPAWVLQVAIVSITGLALAQAMWKLPWRFPLNGLTPAAGGVGALSAMSGGGGFLLGPLMLSAGINGNAYVATGAITAVFIHISRLIGYGANGMVSAQTFVTAGWLAACIVLGNLMGRSLRQTLTARSLAGLEYGTPFVVALIAIAGLMA